jgi:hypothetical protein
VNTDTRNTLNVMAGMLAVSTVALARRRNRWLDGQDRTFVLPSSKSKGLKAKRKRERQARRQAQACARRRR